MSLDRAGCAPKASRRSFFLIVAASVAIKLWLMSGFRIVAAYLPHDASNFLVHARTLAVGHWFGAYDDLTLIKQPFYPMWLALVEQSGLPLNVDNQLLNALASFTACMAVRPLIRSWKTLSVIFVVLFFNPFTFDSLARVLYRSHINPALALLTVSCALAVLIRRRRTAPDTLPWLVGCGVSFSAFWLTREEAVWLAPCLAVILGAYLWWSFLRRRDQLQGRIAAFVLPAVVFALSIGIVMAINGHLYGWAVTNEQQAPEFVSAYNSLTRIDVPKQRYVPLPQSARRLAYAVSPAARELEPSLDGPNGAGWATISCGTLSDLCATHEIGGGWAEWALRDAVQNAGHYNSGADARAYYIRLASEIDAACAAGRLRCTKKSRSVFPPPIHRADIIPIFADFIYGYRALIGEWTWNYGVPEAPPVLPSLRLDYDFIVRGVYDPGSYHRFTGWLLYDHSQPPLIQGAGSAAAQLVFLSSPDLVTALAGVKGFSGADKEDARFEVTSSCDESCVLIVPGAKGAPITIPLATDTLDFHAPGVLYHLDLSRRVSEFDGPLKDRALIEIGRTYQHLFGVAFYICLILVAVRIVRMIVRRRVQRLFEPALLTVAILVSTTLLLFLLAIINAVAFPNAFNEEYMGAINPLVLFSSALVIALEGTTAYRFARRYLPRADFPHVSQSTS